MHAAGEQRDMVVCCGCLLWMPTGGPSSLVAYLLGSLQLYRLPVDLEECSW
jgi:hypothetical protein